MDDMRELERQVADIVACLRTELGYRSELPGNLHRQIEEHDEMIRQIDETLRGRGGELGLVGWMVVLRRSWIAMVALLGTALGYFLNDVVDALEGRSAMATPRAAVAAQAR